STERNAPLPADQQSGPASRAIWFGESGDLVRRVGRSGPASRAIRHQEARTPLTVGILLVRPTSPGTESDPAVGKPARAVSRSSQLPCAATLSERAGLPARFADSG